MKRRGVLVISLGLGVAIAILVAGLFGQPLYSATRASLERLVPGLRAGPEDLYTYGVETKGSGKVYVIVRVNFRDEGIRRRYLEANTAKAQALIAKGGTPVRVTVTFKQPVPSADFEALVKATGFQADRYTLETQDPQGRPGTITVSAQYTKGDKLVDMDLLAPGLERRPRSINGAVILVGNVPLTKEGLGRLLSDPRVYLVDVVAAELLDKVGKETGAAKDMISIDVHSPYSLLATGGQ